MNAKFFLITIFCMFFFGSLFAQATRYTLQYQVETRDGNLYAGKIISEDSVRTVMETKVGIITIPASDIKSRSLIQAQQIKDGVLWFNNPQATRYFFAPNGYGLGKGEAYYQNIWLFFNQAVVGITRNFSIGAGLIPLFMLDGAPTPVWLAPKVSIPVVRNKVNIAAGALVGTVIGEPDASFGILYSNATIGSRDKNVSFGTGFLFAGGEFANIPLFNLAAMVRVTNRGYFLTENYFMVADGQFGGFLLIGGRWIIKKAALDYGLSIPVVPDMGVFVAIPWLGITIPFGRVP